MSLITKLIPLFSFITLLSLHIKQGHCLKDVIEKNIILRSFSTFNVPVCGQTVFPGRVMYRGIFRAVDLLIHTDFLNIDR